MYLFHLFVHNQVLLYSTCDFLCARNDTKKGQFNILSPLNSHIVVHFLFDISIFFAVYTTSCPTPRIK